MRADTSIGVPRRPTPRGLETRYLDVHGVALRVEIERDGDSDLVAAVFSLFEVADGSHLGEIEPVAAGEIHLALARHGLFSVHAAGVRNRRGNGILLPGVSGSGKTTVALAALAGGFGFAGDDKVLLRRRGTGIDVLPLRGKAFVKDPGGLRLEDLAVRHSRDVFRSFRVDALAFPAVVAAPESVLEPLAEAATPFRHLIASIYWVPDPALRREQVELLRSLMELPAWRLALGADNHQDRNVAVALLDRI